MRRFWKIELLMDTDIEDFTSIAEYVTGKLTDAEQCTACCVNSVSPVPPLPAINYEMKYPPKPISIDLLEEKDPHTLGKSVQYVALNKVLDMVKRAPLSTTVLHPRHRGRAEKLCRELGEMWLDAILHHFEKQEEENFMQMLKEVEDESKDS